MMGLKIKRMLWYNREFVILSPPFIVLQPCSFLYFDGFLAILCQNNAWFALRRKSLSFWSWYQKCVLSTLDNQFFFCRCNHSYITSVLAITAQTCWQFITFLIINWPFAPTLECSVACKAPRKCLHMKLISKSEQNLTSWMPLIFLQLTFVGYYIICSKFCVSLSDSSVQNCREMFPLSFVTNTVLFTSPKTRFWCCGIFAIQLSCLFSYSADFGSINRKMY